MYGGYLCINTCCICVFVSVTVCMCLNILDIGDAMRLSRVWWACADKRWKRNRMNGKSLGLNEMTLDWNIWSATIMSAFRCYIYIHSYNQNYMHIIYMSNVLDKTLVYYIDRVWGLQAVCIYFIANFPFLSRKSSIQVYGMYI